MDNTEHTGIELMPIDQEMKSSYLAYAMSVIVGRALPDVRDGLKPVHRRILYAMLEAGYTSDKAYKKCARIVGDVLGRYHPHGDSAVYESIVRMAQDFSMRYLLIDGQGNYGSIDGDNAAAMRYTEARMSKISMEMIKDIEKETVDFTPNFDESLEEPTVLPTRLPGLLLNGTSGIAVGMATNIPPHQLGELLDGVDHIIDDPACSIDSVMTHVKGPDFPTGGIICGTDGITSAYHTGRGSVKIRAKVHFEESKKKNKTAIIVTELPYMVNKANLIIKIAELVQDKKIPDISDLRDESDRKGMRIYIELKRDAQPEVVLNQLYKHTALQNSFGVNMVAIVNGTPQTLNLKQVLVHYIDHRKEIVVRRATFDLKKAKARMHILEGLRIALQNIDAVIALIKQSENAQAAKSGLVETFGLTEIQAQAILDMRLQKLTGLERDKIEDEYQALIVTIADLEDILANESRVYGIIKTENHEIREKYNDARRTVIGDAIQDVNIEDLIPQEDVVVLVTKKGFLKRMPLGLFRTQLRGGRGVGGIKVRDEDMIEHVLVVNTHDFVLCFSSEGRVFKIKAYEIPEASRQAKGVSAAHFLALNDGEVLTAIIHVADFNTEDSLVMVTQKGIVKKTAVKAFIHFKNRAIVAIRLDDGDTLKWVRRTDGQQDVLLITVMGMSIRFNESQVRETGRSSRGVKGINLKPNDAVVAIGIINPEEEKSYVLIMTRYGYGKTVLISHFRPQTRGGVGVRSIKFRVSLNDDRVVDAFITSKDDECLIVTEKGTMCRQLIKSISTQKREAQGVRIIKLDAKDKVTAIAMIEAETEETEHA
jgi:DNA gyrase subunit A